MTVCLVPTPTVAIYATMGWVGCCCQPVIPIPVPTLSDVIVVGVTDTQY